MSETGRSPVTSSTAAAIDAFESVMTGMEEPCLLVGVDGIVVEANGAARAELGPARLRERVGIVDLLSTARPDGDDSVAPPRSVDQFLQIAWRSGQSVPTTVYAGDPARRWRCEAWRLRVGPGGRPAPFLVLRLRLHSRSIHRFAVIEQQFDSLSAEVREHRATAARLRATTDKLETIFGSAPIGMALAEVDGDGSIVLSETNGALRRLVGMATDERVSLSSILDAAWYESAAEAIVRLRRDQRVVQFDTTLRHLSGDEISVSVSASRLNDDGATETSGPVEIVLQVVDLTERRRYERQLRYLADHDALTGLLNRRRFEEELEHAVARSRRYDTEASLLLIDLDDFKGVNDSHGHAIGDRLLTNIAGAIGERLRETDVFARQGGDEFAVLLWDTDLDAAVVVAEAIRGAIIDAAVVDFEGRTVRTSGTIGVAPLTGEGAGEQVLVEADLAMYEAKRSGRDRVGLADPTGEVRDRVRVGHAWVQRIREAFDDDLFLLYAQPLLDLRTREITRHEILLRMDDGNGGVTSPAEFLEVAERYGQIHSIDRWVVDNAVSILEGWQADPSGPRSQDVLEVNLSGATMTDAATIEFIEGRVRDSGIDATRLVFEITETAAIVNIGQAQHFAQRLSSCGCGFALDDVGSGFGSFYYLKHLPSDVIKIDGDYIRDLPESPVDQLIVRSIIDIARGMDKEIVAEWVSCEETLELLGAYGVTYAQGYHIGRPRPVEELTVEHS